MTRVINSSYHKYINSDIWRQKRRERLHHDNYRCTRCPETEALEVHHNTYERLGRERLTDLQTLCSDCHAREHGRDPELPATIHDWRDYPDRVRRETACECYQEIVCDAMEFSARLDELSRRAGWPDDDPRIKCIKGNLSALMRETAEDFNVEHAA
jgi:hypothetical protein